MAVLDAAIAVKVTNEFAARDQSALIANRFRSANSLANVSDLNKTSTKPFQGAFTRTRLKMHARKIRNASPARTPPTTKRNENLSPRSEPVSIAHTHNAVPPSNEIQIISSDPRAIIATLRAAGIRMVALEYELANPPGTGSTEDVENAWSLTAPVGAGVSVNGHCSGNINGIPSGT
jgi:microsomal dipeptidase-like Zn-dependent dipeptidase